MEFRFEPDPFEQQRTARTIRAADGSISRRGLARGTVVPGLRRKCTHGRSRNAGASVNIGRGARGEVPRGDMALASHGGSCEHGCGDHGSRQKCRLGHSISPLDMKSRQCWLPYGSGAATDRSKEHLLTSFQRRVRLARHAIVRLRRLLTNLNLPSLRASSQRDASAITAVAARAKNANGSASPMSRSKKADGNDRRLELLEHVGGKTFGIGLSIQAGPKAINLIALDTADSHQRPTGAQPNKIATL